MSLYKNWKDLTENQTNATFESFWKEYCDAEIRIYTDILKDPKTALEGTFGELREKYDVKATLFMGFLDGISTSLLEELPPLASVTEETALRLRIDPEKLYFNMHTAEASHLYALDGWKEILPEETRQQIAKEYKRSKTVVKEKKPGRNDPCPCGSGRKYKQCCGKA